MNKKNVFKYDAKTLRNLQLKSLEIYRVLLKFCEENNLKIYFCGGCLIGAIRDGGFVPWDDDVDVFMPRDDYEKLKELWPKKGDTANYTLSVPSIDNYTKGIFITFNDNNTTFIKEYQVDLDINHGIRLDILPLDGCPNSKIKRHFQKRWALVYSLYCAQTVPVNHGKFVALVSRILLSLVPSRKVRWKIVRLAEKQMSKYKFQNCEFVTELCAGSVPMHRNYRKEWFDDVIYKKFEGYDMPVPVGYDDYLKMAFGDYMKLPPKEKQVPEHTIVFCDLENGYEKYRGKYYLN